MPQVVKMGEEAATGQAVVKGREGGGRKRAGKKQDGPRQVPLAAMIGAGVALLAFLLILVNAYVTPLVPRSPAAEKIAPPPGYPDTYPYNTKEWQANGQGRRLPGTPPR